MHGLHINIEILFNFSFKEIQLRDVWKSNGVIVMFNFSYDSSSYELEVHMFGSLAIHGSIFRIGAIVLFYFT